MSAVQDFITRLYKRVASQEKGNIFLSPYSLDVALAMTSVGAREETRTAFEKLLALPSELETQNDVYQEAIKKIDSASGVEMMTANALWVQVGYPVLDSFTKALEKSYGATVQEVDYIGAKAAAVAVINAWVSQKTKEKIPTLVSEDLITRDTRLILTNAIYFKGKWKTEFDEKNTKPRQFTDIDGKESDVPTMSVSSEFLYAEKNGVQMLGMPYSDDAIGLFMISSDRANGIHKLEDDFSTDYLRNMYDSMSERKVHVTLPRFKMETSYKMKQILCDLGADIIFDNDRSNFSGIADPETTKERLKVSEVIHKAFVETNEKGTEAAAATAVLVMRCTSAMPSRDVYFRADHPFLFVIYNTKLHYPMFVGRVATIS